MSSTIVQSPAANHRLRLAALPPLALYVHLPWCVRKCPYCDFNSHEARGALPEDAYVDALIADLESALPDVWGRRVHSVFLGGGTPSLFAARSIDRLLAAIRARLPLEPDAEITLEANPGTFESDKFRDFRAAGLNRLSIGIQSFDPKHLAALGRIHDEREAHAVEIAHAHFENFNLDLMFALPEQTVAGAERDVERRSPHAHRTSLSITSTIEPNTVFFTDRPRSPTRTRRPKSETWSNGASSTPATITTRLRAYAQPGRACRHNLNYWRFGDLPRHRGRRPREDLVRRPHRARSAHAYACRVHAAA